MRLPHQLRRFCHSRVLRSEGFAIEVCRAPLGSLFRVISLPLLLLDFLFEGLRFTTVKRVCLLAWSISFTA